MTTAAHLDPAAPDGTHHTSGSRPAAPPAAAPRDPWTFIETAQIRITQDFPDADLLANLVLLSVTRAASAILYDLESTIHRPLGGTWSGFRVLFALWLGGPQSPHDVSEVSGMSRATVSNMSRTLVEKGLVEKNEDPADGRGVVLSLTPAGLDNIRESFDLQHQREREWAGLLSPLEQQMLVMLLDKMMSARHKINANERS